MPNHVTTRLTIIGSADQVEKFVETHIVGEETEKRTLDFETILPMPDVLTETQAPNKHTDEAERVKAETGFENWHDWRCAKWGTKWNTYHFSDIPNLPGDTTYICHFDTAWSYPEPVFKELAERFPSLLMVVAFFDEGHLFAGQGRAESPLYCEATDELYEIVYSLPPAHEPAENHNAEFDLEPEME